MRLLELSQRYPPAIGGVEATLGELVTQLRSIGIDVQVYSSDLARNYPFTRLAPSPRDQVEGVRRFRAYRTLPLPLGLGIIEPGMLGALGKAEVDLIHAHAFGYFPTYAGALARRGRKVPLIVTPHADPGRHLAFSSLYHRVVARATLRTADRVITQSATEERFLSGLGVDPSRMVRIPTGIVVEDFARAEPTAGILRLLYVGRIDPEQKGLPTLVRAVARLPGHLEWRLLVQGDDWGGVEPAQRLARRLGVSNRITMDLAPPRERILAAYRAADIFVLPSRFESFPRVLLEAMASGLPVVATRVGGVPEATIEGQNALLVAPDDADGLAAALRTLAFDPALRERFAKASRRRAEEFSWTRLIPRYQSLFDDVLAGRSAG